MNVFDFVNSMSHSRDIELNEENEKDYNAFLINKAFSYYPDTLLYSAEINLYSVEKDMHFSYFINSIRPKKRFAPWVKKQDSDDLDAVMIYYDYSHQKASQVLPLLSKQQLDIIKSKIKKE